MGGRALHRAAAPPALLVLALSVATAPPAIAQVPEEQLMMEEFFPGETVERRLPGEGEQPAEAEEARLSPEELIDRITFQVPFPAEKGGGTAVGSAGNLEYLREDYVVATGGVELRFRDMKFQAERVAVDLKTQELTAEGDVIIDQGPRRLTGETAVFDLETETGSLSNAKAFVDPDIFFEGEEVAKTGENTYVVSRGTLTSCLEESPDWSLRLSRAQVTVEGFARVRNARFQVKKLPVLYWPYILYPAKTERSSGFLFPNLGYSQRRGVALGLAYFQTLGDSYDATLYADLYGEDYFGFGTEFRYRPNADTAGIFEGYAIEDPVENTVRWRVNYDHVSENLLGGMRGVIRVQDFSDFNFFQDFERDFSRASVRRLQSSGFLSGNWGQHSLTMLVEQNEAILTGADTIKRRQLPEVEYRLRSYQLGGLPVYVDLLSSINYFTIDRGEVLNIDYARADLFPRITVPLSTLPWLSLSVTAGERVTHYTDSIDDTGTVFTGQTLTRTFPIASASVVGPLFSRVFDKQIGRFGRFKHLIEPRFSWVFVDDFRDQDLVPVFDEVDTLRSQHLFGYAFVNRLLAKPADEELYPGGAREILQLEIAQGFSLDNQRPLQVSRDGEQQTTRGPLTGRLRYNPSSRVSLDTQASYNTLFNRLSSASVSGGVRYTRAAVGITHFTRFNPETGDTTGNQLRLFTGFELWPTHFRIDSQIAYDFQTALLQSQRHILQYFSQCWSVRVELAEFRNLVVRNREFRFALTLKNIGTFLDLTGGTRYGFNPVF